MSDCIEWRWAKTPAGYGVMRFEGKNMYAHRLAWMYVHGRELVRGEVVRHSCDNPKCISPRHLSVGSTADNARDMAERGRSGVRWSKNPHAKLNEADVRFIRRSGMSVDDAVRRFGVSRTTVRRVLRRRTWRGCE